MSATFEAIKPNPRLRRRTQGHPLDCMFAPRSVAVIGATESPGSVGRSVIANLTAGSFSGAVYAVNPKRATVLGHKAYPSISSIPGPVDLAVIVTPAPSVPGLIRECVDLGIRAAVIISAGFKEIGAPGVALEAEILKEARRGKMRIIGPNCLGVMTPQLGFNATFAHATAQPGKVAFLSQSGALCTAVLDWSFRESVGFSAFVSVGSMLDVSWGDLIDYFGSDPATKSIVIYMESIGDARSFLSAAREVALHKPIIVIKCGRTEAAARAAASHTGALTGSDDVVDAAFRRVGVLRVNEIEELFDMAQVLGKQPGPNGPKLTIVTNAGGPAVLATDMLINSGGQLAELSASTMAELNTILPPHWSHNNPVDLIGDADAERYAKAVAAAAKDPNSDGLLVVLTPQAMTEPTKTAEALKAHAHTPGKPLLASWMGGAEMDRARSILNAAGIPTFDYPDTAARAFEYMWRYSSNLRALYETPLLVQDSETAEPRDGVGKIIAAARKEKRVLLSEYESKQVMRAYGIPVTETRVAATENEAVKFAETFGYPVVLKLHSHTLTHKTDVGGVQLDLRNASAVRRAWKAIQSAVRERAGEEHFLGVTVQPMMARHGYELIIGSSIDPQFGPVLLFGSGGELAEIVKDRALGFPPLNATLALRMIEQTKIFKALRGVRGRKPVDIEALKQLLVSFSRLVMEQPWIKEIDINPLLASEDRLIALDARVVLHPLSMREEELPRPAIRPYPTQYITRWKLRSGTPVTIRPIRPEDEPLLVRFHETLSERTVYYRYFTFLKLGQRISHDRLTRICFNDYDREIALVAEHRSKGGQREILGVGRLSKLHAANEAEFAVLVSDERQHQGLGTELLKLLKQVARAEKLDRLIGHILPENTQMQHIAAKLGFELEHKTADGEYLATINL